jgi:transcriptional regulator with XRE-family HTH domain
MTPTTLAAWRERLGLNRSEAALALGLSRNGYTRYEEGVAPIPLYIALACAALAYGLPPIQ